MYACTYLDGDALFLLLSHLLSVNAGNFNVVVSPLRATILEVHNIIVADLLMFT